MLIFKVTWRTQCDSHSVQYPHAGWGAGNRKHSSGCRHPTQRASRANCDSPVGLGVPGLMHCAMNVQILNKLVKTSKACGAIV